MDSFGIISVPGIRVGHYTDREAATGCTVVLCDRGAVGGVDVRGSAPGTRETDLLRPTNLVSEVHGILLSGGSAFGLDAASGVMRYLEENGIGIRVGISRIPIVAAAILYDLGVVTNLVRPGPDEGYAACEAASTGPVAEGSVGAGTGATVGKLLGMARVVKGGIGTANIDLGIGLNVGAIVVVNSIGGVYNYRTGAVIAGPRCEDGKRMHDAMKLIISRGFTGETELAPENTTIGIVATNAYLNKEQTNKLASVGHDGLEMAVRPAHTMSDGDVLFSLATGEIDRPVNMNRLCAAAALCVATAIVRGVQKAESLGGIPCVEELTWNGFL